MGLPGLAWLLAFEGFDAGEKLAELAVVDSPVCIERYGVGFGASGPPEYGGHPDVKSVDGFGVSSSRRSMASRRAMSSPERSDLLPTAARALA